MYRVYLSGPIRGIEDKNAEAFRVVEDKLTDIGYIVFNPVKISDCLNYERVNIGQRHYMEHVMSIDISCILKSDAICVLPGWETSQGAIAEVALAMFWGITILDAVTLEPIKIEKLVPVIKGANDSCTCNLET